MNKVYQKIIAYNPTKDEVTDIRLLTYSEATDPKASDEAFYSVYHLIDKKKTIIVGKTIRGNFLQLSPSAYGTYIKENESSMRFVNKGKMLCAIERYHREHHLEYDLFED